MAPDARVLELAARHDSDTFLAEELERRDALQYPPAAAVVRIQVAAFDEADAEQVATELVEVIAAAGLDALGPAELFRMRDRFRRQLLIRSVNRDLLVAAVDSAVAQIAATDAGRRCAIGTEVDAG